MSGEHERAEGRNSTPAVGTGVEAGDRVRARTRAGRLLFGDRIGLALFLGTLCFGVLIWRNSVFITDNVTLARTLGALSEGRLWVEPAGEGALSSPGAEVRDGRVYGRNYGQLVVSLPALWLLRGVDAVANLRVGLTGACHLVGLALGVVVSDLLGRRRTGTVLAGVFVLVSFLANLALATQIPSQDMPMLALQVTGLVATALGSTVLYRLLATQGRRRVAWLAGAASVLALPVGFWAAAPKRHVFSVLAVLTILHLFALSRRRSGLALPVVGTVALARAGMYAVVGLLTWVHAAEGLFVFVVVLVADLPTAPRNSTRTLLTVGAVFGLSMLPTLVTNALVTGELARPPRTLGGGVVSPATGDGVGTAAASGDSGALGTAADLVPGVLAWFVRNILTLVGDSVAAAGSPERVYNIFVRSAGSDLTGNRPEFIGDVEYAGVNLAVLEAAPVLALGVAALRAWLVSVRERLERLRQVDPTALLATGLAVSFVALYLSRLPLYTQFTQRYLLPVFPLGLYVLARSPVVARLADRATGAICWAYAGGVLVGGQLLLATVLVRDLPPGEVAQLNARLSLVAAGLVAVTGLLAVRTGRSDRPAGVAVGLACAAATVFVLVAHLHYFSNTGRAVLPVVQEISNLLDT